MTYIKRALPFQIPADHSPFILIIGSYLMQTENLMNDYNLPINFWNFVFLETRRYQLVQSCFMDYSYFYLVCWLFNLFVGQSGGYWKGLFHVHFMNHLHGKIFFSTLELGNRNICHDLSLNYISMCCEYEILI